MTKTIEFFYDFISPYSYLAWTQSKRLSQDTGATISYRPVSVRDIMEKTGNVPTSVTCPPKMKYGIMDVGRWAQKYQVPVKVHPRFGKFDTRELLKASIVAHENGQGEQFDRAIFEAIWVNAADVETDAGILSAIAKRVPDAEGIWRTRDSAKEAYSKNLNNAVAAGAFGVPTYVTEKGLYFGNDRLDFLKQDLAT